MNIGKAWRLLVNWRRPLAEQRVREAVLVEEQKVADRRLGVAVEHHNAILRDYAAKTLEQAGGPADEDKGRH